ncbi:PKD domain-containing protein [Chloroflexota bacterium]
MMLKSKISFLSMALAVLLAITLLPLLGSMSASGYDGGLQNSGFESGDIDPWIIEPDPPPDTAEVVGEEGPADYKTYSATNTTASPYRGDYMLRLGSPKSISEKQQKGMNTVSQTFTANTSSLRFAFRLFSWEHRGNDSFGFDLKSGEVSVGNITEFQINMPGGETTLVSPATPPCDFTIDVGDRKDFLDSGWVEVNITDIPTGTPLTLTYYTGGDANSAHATWAYFDNANTPPVAQFDVSPELPWEGDIIEFIDKSYDTDSDDTIVSWEWNILWTEQDATSGSDLRNPFFIPVDEGTYDVKLTVTDSNGATGELTKTITVDNAPPAVNALDVEVLAGGNADLFGRFIDPGWGDNHTTAVWSIDGTSTEASIQEENLAFMGTGIVTGTLETSTLPAGTIMNGTLEVFDDSGDSSSNAFTVTIVDADILEHEGNNTTDTAPSLDSDKIHLSYIQSLGDIDIFEIVAADGSPLPTGSETLVTLEGLPNDYDMVLLSERPTALEPGGFQMGGFQMGGFQMGGYQMGGYQMGGYQMGGFQMGGFQMGGFQMGGYQMGAFQMGGYQMGGFQMGGFQMGAYQMGGFQMGAYQMGGFQMGDGSADYPLSQIIFAGVEGAASDSIGGTDISLAELGLSLAEITEGSEGICEVVGFSANRGLAEEVLLANVDTTGTRLFVVVVGANGAFSPEPYSLRIETSQPLDIASILGPDGIYTPPVTEWNGTETVIIPTDYGTLDPKTLFVTQKERVVGRYGQEEWDALESAFVNLAGNGAIAGDIISVPISIYSDWDSDYSSIDEVNNVVFEIRSIVDNYLAEHDSIQYIVILGNDDIIPFHRAPDMTSIGNERQYAMTSFLRPGSPLFYSILGGYILTDDYLVDELPIIWQGRPSYVPDMSVARLVEKPEEMVAAAVAFTTSNGQLALDTALVTGYDFFDDGAQAVIDTLMEKAGIIADSLLPDSDLWDANDLLDIFLVDPSYDINNINAHYTHYSAISAHGFETDDFTDIITSLQISDADLVDAIILTMGCHAGLNVPDESAPSAESLGLDINPQVDLAQAMNRAVLVGSTGFGYGDDEGIGGTEYLMGVFVDQLLDDGPVTIGEALVSAKQSYRTSTSTWTVYDDKSSIQFTLYGLPQYSVAVNGDITTQSASSQESGSGSDVTLSDYDLQIINTGNGDYYTADGDSQSTAFRPVQPRIVITLSTDSTGPVHGILLLNGSYEDIYGFDPVITRPTNEWELVSDEIQLLPPTFWPAELATVNTLETGGDLIQTLVVTPGQFLGTGTTEDGEIIGTQRLYPNLQFQLTRSSSDDYDPPAISGIDLEGAGETVNVTVEAKDDSGITKILILKYSAGQMTQVIPLSSSSSGDTFIINIPNPGDDSLIIQVEDGAGNVATATGKGANLSVITVDTDPDPTITENSPIELSATLSDFETLTQPVFYTWDFDDGTFATGQTTDGEIVVQHIYPDDDPGSDSSSKDFVTSLKVTDSNGGIGNAVTTVTVEDVPPVVTINSITSPINENEESTVTGFFTDVGPLDTHDAVIQWGNGTDEPVVETLIVSPIDEDGKYWFTASHLYLDDEPTLTLADEYEIIVTVTDDDTLAGTNTTFITVKNVTPEITAEVTPATISENGMATVSGTISDPGSQDTFSVEIDWGGDEGSMTYSYPAGSTSYEESHRYLDDNPTGTPSDAYSISVTITDDDGGVDTTGTAVNVDNVAPTVVAGTDQIVYWSQVVSLDPATFSDTGTQDTCTATIDWGDNSVEAGTVSETNGSGTVSGSHVYTDHGTYTVTVTVTDDDLGAGSDTLTITVAQRWSDPEGDVGGTDGQLADGDIIGGDACHDGTTMTIVLRVAEPISNRFQYRIKLVTDSGSYHLKYDDGKLTGLKKLQAVVNGNELRFAFKLSSIGLESGDHVQVSMETQGGIPSETGIGIIDNMPDSGTSDYDLP